jgi:polysaccharide biosynthesis PFTS motif protein
MNFIIKFINYVFFNQKFENKLVKAYQIINKKKKINQIYKLKSKLQKILYKNKDKLDSNYKNFNLNIYNSLSQYIYSRFINNQFFNIILIFSLSNNTKLIFPLPKKYLIEINKLVKVNFFLSRILFTIILFIDLIIQLIKILFSFFIFFKIKDNKSKIYLNAIPKLESSKGRSADFYKWVYETFSLASNISFIHENNQITDKSFKFNNNKYYTNYCTSSLSKFYNLYNIKYYLISLIHSLYSLIRIILFFEIELLLLIKEIFNFNFYKNLKVNDNFKLCLFNNSNMIFRPLWTYVNEKNIKGSVVFYFYSSNIVPLLHQINKEKYHDIYGFSLLNWPKYVVWSSDQEKWISKYIKNKKTKFIITKTIPFAGKNFKTTKQKKIITIFDVPPKKPLIYCMLNNSYNIYTLKYCIKFIDDILNAIPKTKKNKIKIILKMKRMYDNIHPKYLEYLDEKVKKNEINLIDDMSPESVIDYSDITISIPFTSTAITSFRKNKKTIFYDPSHSLTKKLSFEKKIKLISSSIELKKWLRNSV